MGKDLAWTFSPDPVKMRYINGILKERADATEAVQALAPFLLIEMARLLRMEEKIDCAFAGEPFLQNEPPTTPRNQERFWAFFNMHKQVMEQTLRVMDQFLKIHGVPAGDAVYWEQMVEISKRLPKKPY
jgi:hypothetical protein